MQTNGGRPFLFANIFAALLGAARAAGNRLLCFLALAVFYPLAAWPVSRATRQKNFAQNAPQSPAGAPVHDQQAPEIRGLRCGHAPVGECGCGPVSVYNALCLLGRSEAGGQGLAAAPHSPVPGFPAPVSHTPDALGFGEPKPSLAGVIGQFERGRALALGGRAGASPYAVPRVLRQYGLAAAPARSFAALEAALPPGGVGIVMIWNDSGRIWRGAHFFAVQRAQSGRGFMGYNCRQNRADTLAGLAANGRFAAGWRVKMP